MGLHTQQYFIPDCPICGQEMEKRMRYKRHSQTEENPFGVKMHYWACPVCDYESAPHPDERVALDNACKPQRKGGLFK